MSRKNTFFFFILVLLSFIVMTYQSKKGNLFSNNPLTGFLNNAHLTIQSFSDTVKSPFRKITLREEENRRLREQIDELMSEREKYQEAFLENKRLKDLLKLREEKTGFSTSARVIARGPDNWVNTMVIDKGLRHGIEKDMSAVTPKGLAGKVFHVSDSFSHLLLITDITFSASVRLQDSRKEGVLSGTGSRNCILKYIPYEEEVKTGDLVITSGLDSLFPPGIPVGYVSRVDNKGSGGHFQHIEVIPFQDDRKIEEVLVVR